MTIKEKNYIKSDYPLISICIPTFNAEKTLSCTLKSILNQEYPNLEIIIVDNASTDRTKKISLKYVKEHGFKYHQNNENIGPVKNLTKCIELANGEYTAIFHADDYYMPKIVKKQLKVFKENHSVGAVFTSANFINDNNEIIGKSPSLPTELKEQEVYSFRDIFISLLKNGNFLMTPSVMVKSKLYKKLSPFDEKKYGVAADLDMWLRILEISPIYILNEPLMCYRLSSTHGSHEYMHLITEKAGFLNVMDRYLVKKDELDIPQDALDQYEFLKEINDIILAANFLIKGQLENSKELLQKTVSFRILKKTIINIRKPRFLVYLIFGVIILSLIYIGLGNYIRKPLYWLMYDLYYRLSYRKRLNKITIFA